MTEEEIVRFMSETRTGVDVVVASEDNGAPEVAWGDTFFYYDPHDDVPADRRIPFATIVTNDYPGFDTESNLGRPGVFRVNMWVSRETFDDVVGDETRHHDFAALDTPLPHPAYGAQGWVSILNPGPATTDLTKTLLAEAHERAVARHQRRASRRDSGE